MKRTLFFLLSAYGLCTAQTTITKAFNDPSAGETVSNLSVTGTVDNSATGANTTFNNASLTLGAAATTTYAAPAAGEITTFPGSTLKMAGSGNTVYYKQSASKLEITGLVTPDATLNLSSNNGTFISYPAAFGYTETDQAQGTFTSSTANGLCKGTINISADASGTLILGANTYNNVLRIKSTQNFSLYLPNDTTFMFPIGTIVNTAYSYYDSTHKFPLLSTTQVVINVPLAGINNQTTNEAQALNLTTLSTGDLTVKKDRFAIYPNPAQDFIEFKGETENYSTAKIYSLDGKLVKTADMKSGKVQVSDLPSAAYFIEVSGKNSKAEAAKFIKK
ncbi:T9SS type A sorting domain-containing protein [Chryseobacterium daeguense]|uniref:T9SS type A sorting domain-containing protein n=1 Tax=Chryseobacterium daeguense TaxID=412438 RepID=UPI00041076C5|nr:T9SS type A sorting domain-containing protein [Chryseobacterium daeguense]